MTEQIILQSRFRDGRASRHAVKNDSVEEFTTHVAKTALHGKRLTLVMARGTVVVLRALTLECWGLSRSIGCSPGSDDLKGKLDLRFQPAIVGRLVESFAVLPARNLVGKPEIRRGDVPDDGPRVRMIEQVPHRQPDAQVEAMRRRRAADQPAQTAAADRR